MHVLLSCYNHIQNGLYKVEGLGIAAHIPTSLHQLEPKNLDVKTSRGVKTARGAACHKSKRSGVEDTLEMRKCHHKVKSQIRPIREIGGNYHGWPDTQEERNEALGHWARMSWSDLNGQDHVPRCIRLSKHRADELVHSSEQLT
jgi:hypothetical protein